MADEKALWELIADLREEFAEHDSQYEIYSCLERIEAALAASEPGQAMGTRELLKVGDPVWALGKVTATMAEDHFLVIFDSYKGPIAIPLRDLRLALAQPATAKPAEAQPLIDAIAFAERVGPLPRCFHGKALKDGAGELLEPSCGCRFKPLAASLAKSEEG